jgi:chromate transporter
MEQNNQAVRVSAWSLFVTFSQITLSAFGGAIFWTRRMLVERRGWLTEREFVELLTIGQLLPGPNVLNLTVMVGYRFGSWRGAAASLAGYLGWPVLVVVGMGYLYHQFGAFSQVQDALSGMSKVAAGLLLATFIKLAQVLPRRPRAWIFGAIAFVAVGVLRWPLFWVIAILAPCAVFAAWREAE